MKILVCPDKFKGSLDASQVCDAIRRGIRRYSSAIEVSTHPLADGGDGMLEILTENIDLELMRVEVRDPLFRPIQASYGLTRGGDTAFIEMSQASGLVLLSESERNCLDTTSLGTGELILDAIGRGVKRVVLGIGGSATTDAGMGVAAALGYRFLDASGEALEPIGKNLALICAIDDRDLVPALARVQIDVASDVQNVFYGREGAAWVFGPQKGADPAAVLQLDEGLRNFARLVEAGWSIDLQGLPGSGAAGGLGGGARALLDARIHSGIGMIIEATRLADKAAAVDLIITGEGMLDEQSLGGKVIDGVLALAQEHDKKVAVLCGACRLSRSELQRVGISYCDQIMQADRSLEDAMTNGFEYLEQCAYQLIRAISEDDPGG